MMSETLTERDRQRSYTSRMLPAIEKALEAIPRDQSHQRLLEVGCGFGGITALVSGRLGAREAHGVDIDAEAVSAAVARGIHAFQWDMRKLPLPFDDASFDIVTSFGALNYLPALDGALLEARRLLRDGGHLVVALPNLLSWHNRLMVLLGYQPRDLEVSSRMLVGVHPRYRDHPPVGHTLGVSTRAFGELASKLGFETVAVIGAAPVGSGASGLTRLVDRIAARRVNLARRFVYVGRKTSSTDSHESSYTAGWWQSAQRSGEA